ncbi:MAG TPA: SIS domain-containing protein [Trueperaceae bacterium]|nr:SIS domain-containing protein [Trueperaceae bacterium]
MHQVIRNLVDRYPELENCSVDLQTAFEAMRACFASGGKLLVCGNGGSAADSEHLVGELMKGFASPRPVSSQLRRSLVEAHPEDGAYLADHLQGALPAIALNSHTALGTATANDVAADMVFAQQVHGYGRHGDVLLGISTSGNSLNVVRAAQVARVTGLKVVGLTGAGGGRLAELCDVCVRVPFDSVSEVQERHLPVYHALSLMLEQEFFPEGDTAGGAASGARVES